MLPRFDLNGIAHARYPATGVTDPGVPGRQNQDEFFLWESADRQTLIAGVLDGHGKELGQVRGAGVRTFRRAHHYLLPPSPQLAARVARTVLLRELTRSETLASLRTSPKVTLEHIFALAHVAISEAFVEATQADGWTVHRMPFGGGAGAAIPRGGGASVSTASSAASAVAAVSPPSFYLTRSRPGSAAPPQCVHGGTTATVIIILDGRRLICSNVGDSTAIITGLGSAGNLYSVDEWAPMRSGGSACSSSSAASAAAAAEAVTAATAAASVGASGEGVEEGGPSGGGVRGGTHASSFRTGGGAGMAHVSGGKVMGGIGVGGVGVGMGGKGGGPLPPSSPPHPSARLLASLVPHMPMAPLDLAGTYMELSADHSPESISEFERIARVRPKASGMTIGLSARGAPSASSSPFIPELLFIYDTLTPSKVNCSPIFSQPPLDATASTWQPTKTERGVYYKNVRSEWGTLVATPPSAMFQDALAFTRSLGDLHLQVRGEDK